MVSSTSATVYEPGGRSGSTVRYSTVAIVLHWTIAAIIVLQLILGWRLSDAEGAQRTVLVGLHKSVGIGILVLSLFRLGWRYTHAPPPEDAGLTTIERRLSHWVHMGFYVALIGLPLSGWLMISARRKGAMLLFDAIPWPRFPIVGLLPGGIQDAVADAADQSHAALVWMMGALLFLHIAGALKHHFVSRDAVVHRMCPGVRPGVVTEPRLLAIAAAGVAMAALAYALNPPVPPPRAKPTQLASADIYLDLVGPVLERRCGACHNDDLSRGGLSVESYDELLQGGRNGAGVAPFAPLKSQIFQRVNLASDNSKFMPKDGKTPLTVEEMQAIGWWISIGAPRSGTIATLKPPSTLLPALTDSLGLAAPNQTTSATLEPLPKVPAGDPAAMSALTGAGFRVRRVDRDSNLLDVNLYQSKSLDAADMANLAKLAPQIRTLDLAEAGASDADLGVVGQMTNLASLRLERNPITDAGVAKLGGLKGLRSLNLYGAKITNASLTTIGALPKLQRLYVWQTGVTKDGVDRLKAAQPHLVVVAEDTAAELGDKAAPEKP